MVLIEEHEDPELPMPATLHQLISSEDDDGDGRPERDEQPQPNATAQEGAFAELQPEAFCHSEELRQALDHLARAQRVLCTITSDVVVDGLERLHAVKRTLQEDLEMATSGTVNERLQVLLKLHAQALEECRCADEKCEAEQPEILMLRRSIAETSRRMPRIRENPDDETSPPQDEAPEHSAVPRSGRLAALQQALALRSRQAQIAKGSLLSEDKLLSAELNVAKNALKEAVMEGQRLEEMKDEAEAEVFRACRALASVEDKGEGDGESVKNIRQTAYQKAREVEAFVAKGPAAPWRLSALHQPSGTGSIGTTAALLDPEAYRLNREKATAQADKDLEAMIEAYVAEKEQIQRAVYEEVQRQKDEEAHFAAELQSLREHIKERRHGIDTALAAQSSEKDQRLLEAQRQLTLELRQIESQERSNQEALRQEVRKARQRLAQAAACAKQQLDLRLAKVRTDCREMLRSTAMQWERAVMRERQALQEAKERREHWQKRLKSSKDAFRGHCVKTGVYARTLDSTRRRILDSLVPRAKVGDVYSWDPKS
mmetsp:Transcript_45349/g.94582  ORF Transcript_45349/g.94582 Transcript_45349/m.94582 type:complete len:544 (-) Transcript_45349:58-1689(-)